MSNLSELLPTGGGQNAVDFVATGNLASGQAVVLKTDGTVEAITETVIPASVGTEDTYNGRATQYSPSVFDSTNNRVVIFYRDGGNSNYGTAIVGTVSGTNLTFGTAEVFQSANSGIAYSATYDSNNSKVVVAYTDPSNADYGIAKVGTVSGTGITFGTKVVYQSVSNTDDNSAAYFPEGGGVVIAFKGSSVGEFIQGTVSGTVISFDTAFQFSASPTNFNSIIYDSTNKNMPIAYVDDDDGYGKAIVSQPGYTTTNNTSFIGITSEAISNTATGAINTYGGINTAQTGLTIASDYYVQADGSLSTTTSTVKAGQAVSATTINMKDLT